MSLSVKILGSNAASFAHQRHHTAQIVQVQSETFLVDCGEATQLQCKKYDVKISRIDHILISHLHGDHYFGLMGLLSTMHLYGRKETLTIIGPPGLAEIITQQLKYSETQFMFEIDFREWVPDEAQQVYESSRLTVTTIPLQHRIPCSGYLFIEKPKGRRIHKDLLPQGMSPTKIGLLKAGQDIVDDDGKTIYKNSEITLPPNPSYSYAFCSDTRYMPELADQLSGVDLLYHEATFMEEMKERAEATFHSTAKQAALLAKTAGVRRLILGHFSTRYLDLNPLLMEARSVFESSFLAIEGETFSLPYP